MTSCYLDWPFWKLTILDKMFISYWKFLSFTHNAPVFFCLFFNYIMIYSYENQEKKKKLWILCQYNPNLRFLLSVCSVFLFPRWIPSITPSSCSIYSLVFTHWQIFLHQKLVIKYLALFQSIPSFLYPFKFRHFPNHFPCLLLRKKKHPTAAPFSFFTHITPQLLRTSSLFTRALPINACHNFHSISVPTLGPSVIKIPI